MKRTFLFPLLLLSLLLLISCSSGSVAVLSSSSEAAVWKEEGKSIVLITVSPEDAASITELSGMTLSESLADIYGKEAVTLIDDLSWKKREGMLSLLMSETGKDSVLSALRSSAEDLEESEYLEIMDDLSGPFSDEALLALLRKKKNAAEYSMEAVLSNSSSWEETRSFVREWTLQALRSI